MNKANLYKKIFWTILVLVSFMSLLSWSYTTYTLQRRKIALLSEDVQTTQALLGKTEELLAKTKSELEQLNQKNDALSKARVVLTEELAEQKRHIAEIVQANEALDQKLGTLSEEKEDLQVQLTKSQKTAERQIDLEEQKFQEQLREQKRDFLTEKNVLSKQIQALETMLENLSVRNEDLRVELMENRQLVERLYKAKEIVDENEELMASLNKSEVTLNGLQAEKEKISQQLKLAKDNLTEKTLRFHYNLGHLYDQNRRYKEALGEYKKALEIAPQDADLHYNLAVLYDEHIRNKKKAIYHYQTYLKLCPEADDVPKVMYWIKKAKQELAATKAGIGSTLPNSF